MHYSNTVFQSRFSPYIKGRYPWKEVAKQKNVLSEQVKFSASDRFRRNLPTVQNGPEKRKNYFEAPQRSVKIKI